MYIYPYNYILIHISWYTAVLAYMLVYLYLPLSLCVPPYKQQVHSSIHVSAYAIIYADIFASIYASTCAGEAGCRHIERRWGGGDPNAN